MLKIPNSWENLFLLKGPVSLAFKFCLIFGFGDCLVWNDDWFTVAWLDRGAESFDLKKWEGFVRRFVDCPKFKSIDGTLIASFWGLFWLEKILLINWI